MIPAILGLGSLLTKVAAAAVVPRIVRALSALGGPPEPIRANPSQDAKEPVSAIAPEPGKSLYGRNPLVRHTRLYDAANKRWISRDPLGEGVDYNLYRYCGNNPVSNLDPDGLEPRIWVGYGPGGIPRVTNIVGAQDATPENVEQALGGGYDIMMLNAHHYPDGQGIKVNGGFIHIDLILKRIPKKKRPKILILNGCRTQRSLPEGKEDKDITIIFTIDLMIGANNTRLQSRLMQELLSGKSPQDAINAVADYFGDSYIRDNVRVYGNRNPRL